MAKSALCAFVIAFLTILVFSASCSQDLSGNTTLKKEEPTSDDDTSDEGDRLYAGVAAGYLKVPIGVSLGGFAARIGFIMPYNKLMGGSWGYIDRPNAKAVVLKRGGQYIVFAKVGMMGVTESLRTQVVNQVRERTGVDLDRSLILNATHTHSGPARFLYVPDLMSLVGMDVFSQEIVDRIAGSITDVISEAMGNMVPARIGFGYREPFDPDERLTEDRRCTNGPGDFKEDRLWVGQVENDDGEALAVLVGMAMHGVVYEYGFFDLTGDAPEGVERAVEDLYDHPVTALFIQGSSGDVVPLMEGPLGHDTLQMTDWIGWQVAQIVGEIQKTIVTDDKPDLKILTRRYYADRETLGYQAGEFGHYTPSGEFAEYEKGAMECGVLANESKGSLADCDNPDTTLVDGYLGCIVDLNWNFASTAVDLLTQSVLTVAQIGDQYFFTAPGEPTSHLAVDIRNSMAETLGVPFENINTIGYAQNYIFYILQDWDWWQGGGETEGSLFGWRYGPWMQKELTWLAGRMADNDPPPDDDPAPKLFQRPEAAVVPEKSEKLAVIDQQPAATAMRFDTVNFVWYGGHPGVDWLTVTLQQEVNGEFVDVKRRNGAPYDDKGWEMAVKMFPYPSYRQERRRETRAFQYRLAWETSKDDPFGTLRFKVTGTAETEDGEKTYELYSDPFVLNPSDTVVVSDLATSAVGEHLYVEATAAYPPDPPFSRRMRSPLSGGIYPAIVPGGTAIAHIIDANGAETECDLTFNDATERLVGKFAPGDLVRPLRIRVEAGAFNDGYGNTNAAASDSISVE